MSTVSTWRSLRTSLCPLGHSDRGDSALHDRRVRRASDRWIEANERGRPPLCGRSEGARGLGSLLDRDGKINIRLLISQEYPYPKVPWCSYHGMVLYHGTADIAITSCIIAKGTYVQWDLQRPSDTAPYVRTASHARREVVFYNKYLFIIRLPCRRCHGCRHW
jgi:hypothetical protein